MSDDTRQPHPEPPLCGCYDRGVPGHDCMVSREAKAKKEPPRVEPPSDEELRVTYCSDPTIYGGLRCVFEAGRSFERSQAGIGAARKSDWETEDAKRDAATPGQSSTH